MNNYITRLCTKELSRENLFVSSEHKQRFSDLMNCYTAYPFFHKGLSKCMYLSCWDFEHFTIMLDILNNMTIGKSTDTEEMAENGQYLENQSEGYDKYIYQLSCALLEGRPFELPDIPIKEEGMFIITQTLKAEKIIDQAFEEYAKIFPNE